MANEWEVDPSYTPEQGWEVDPLYQADAATTIPAEQPRGWLEAFFPRSAGAPASMGAEAAALGLDALSLPGRAYASLARPEGESYQQALGRLHPNAMGDYYGPRFTQQISEQIMRDPASLPLAALGAVTGGTAVAPWLARLGWAGKGLATGTAMGSTVAATRQGENVAAGRPLDATEAGKDVALGAALGLGGATLGRGLQAAGNRAAPAAMKLAKVGVKYREGVEKALPEMIRRGMLGTTVGSMERRAAAMESDITGRYAAAKLGTEGIPAVPLGLYGERAGGQVRAMADRGLIGPEDEAAAIEWITARANRPASALGAPSPAMADVPTAITARSTARKAAGSYESQAPNSSRREAMQEAADEFAAGINERLAQVAPAVREVDQFAAPFYQTRPFMDALARRGNNYELGPMELWAAGTGGALGSGGGPVGTGVSALAAGAAARLQRSPLYPYLLNKLGQNAALPGQTIPLGTMLLRGSATDNARGR
jgi:hypothetical protein